MKNLSKSLKWFIVFLVVIVVGSLAASLVQNSFFSVKVDKISFETERGELSGYLYTPRGVDADNPAPTVVLTHGYLNNAEMQEIGAIELSRRGYVVLAFDMYDHGDSVWETPAAFNFFVYAVKDAVDYMYEQDYVLKDADGNGMIGVSGHSMGGFSSSYAVVFDEAAAPALGYRKIAAALPVGSDYRYVYEGAWDIYGTRSAGHISAHYDQFFFDSEFDDDLGITTYPTDTVIYKDFTKDLVGLKFLGRDDEGSATAGTWYNKDGGQRVIFTPDETHPQTTWSIESGKNTVEFFETAFEYQLDLHGLDDLEAYGIKTGSTAQVWWLKEAFTLIALIGLVGMIFPLFSMVSKLPIFNKMYREEAVGEETVELEFENKKNNYMKYFVIAIVALIAAYYLPHFMNRSVDDLATVANAMYYVIGGVAFFTLMMWVGALLKDDNESAISRAKSVTLGAITIAFVALAYRWLLTNTDIITEVTYWSAPSINTIVYWAMASAGLILIVTLSTTPIFTVGKNAENTYGLKTTFVQLLASLFTAIVLAFGLFLVIALVEWIFLTDFRFYTYAIKIFNSHQFVAALRYIPLFFIYYFAAGISIYVNTGKMKNLKGDVLAAFLLAGPVVLFLIYQYFILYNTGVAAFPTFSLSAILSVGLVPTLVIAAIIMRRFSIKTNNIWTGVFFTTIFFTIITLANTVVYLLTIG
ncbi:MAG: alpha/beta hydrolase [Tenericutes bacterium]|jgi:pimeloyl-ACP methyl ester carboxylesterase|nr:alpha/beta hydrolase [Mycoplasmatota bacterium]